MRPPTSVAARLLPRRLPVAIGKWGGKLSLLRRNRPPRKCHRASSRPGLARPATIAACRRDKNQRSGGDDGQHVQARLPDDSGPGRGRLAVRRLGSRSTSLPVRLRPAAQYRLQPRGRHLCRQAQGAEQEHHAHRPVSGRATGPGAAGAAVDEGGRHRVLHQLGCERGDAVTPGGRDVAAFPVPLRGSPEKVAGRSSSRRTRSRP